MTALTSCFQFIRDSRICISKIILDQVISDRNNFALNDYKDLSVEPSDNYAIKNAKLACFDDVHWPERQLHTS